MATLNSHDEITFFGQTNFRDQQRKFGIKLDDRRRHMYIIGKTGMGKTTLLENMLIQDIKNGHGLAFLDPHGDSAEKILEFIPPHRINDVIYFNPADMDYPIAFNVLETVDENLRNMVASGLVGVFKKLWADSWGPRLEYLLRNAILALLDNKGSTLLGVMRVLTDKAYRKKIVANVKDPVVRSFWVDEFARYTEKFAQEAIAPIQNKIGQFLSNSIIRNIVGQVSSSFNTREVLDSGKILIMNLSKGRIGEDTAHLLGAMMVTQLQLAAMTRVDIPENDRKDFFLYVDEFQNFTSDSFADILSEARKYHLGLVIAHQYIEQLSDVVKAAVFGNVGTLMSFRVGASDASVLEKDFGPRFTATDLVNLTKYEIYLKLMIDGVASDPFSARTLPPLFEPEAPGTSEKVVRVSRERYGRNRQEVEDKIMRWSMGDTEETGGLSDDEALATPGGVGPTISIREPVREREPETVEIEFKGKTVRAEQADRPNGERTLPWLCDNCGKVTYLSFQPNPKKPVYCKKCLKQKTQERENALPPGKITIVRSNQPSRDDQQLNSEPKPPKPQAPREQPHRPEPTPPKGPTPAKPSQAGDTSVSLEGLF